MNKENQTMTTDCAILKNLYKSCLFKTNSLCSLFFQPYQNCIKKEKENQDSFFSVQTNLNSGKTELIFGKGHVQFTSFCPQYNFDEQNKGFTNSSNGPTFKW